MAQIIEGVGYVVQSKVRSAAQEYLASMYYEGLSGAGALHELRGMELGYRTQDFYDDWRNITGYEKGKSAIMGLKSNSLVPESLWGSEYQSNQKRFRYVVNDTVLDPETGALDLQKRWLTTDKYLTNTEIEDEMGAQSDAYLKGYPLVRLQTTLVGVWARKE